MKILPGTLAATLAGIALTGLSSSASAYVGPGAGITAIGSLLALLAGILLAVLGFVWYPLKRFFRSRSGRQGNDTGTAQPPAEQQDKPGNDQ